MMVWVVVGGIVLVGFAAGAMLRSYWALLLPPALTALWIVHYRNTTNTEPEETWFWAYVAMIILYMLPGLAGVALGCLVRRRALE
jgi:hypothetical protein